MSRLYLWRVSRLLTLVSRLSAEKGGEAMLAGGMRCTVVSSVVALGLAAVSYAVGTWLYQVEGPILADMGIAFRADSPFLGKGGFHLLTLTMWLVATTGLGVGVGQLLSREHYMRRKAEQLSLQYQRQSEQLLAVAKDVNTSYRLLREGNLKTARSLVMALEARDPYTKGHSQRVAQYAHLIARAMGLKPDDTYALALAAELHDIGKVGVPDAVLLKPASLSPSELAEIQLHPLKAVEILRFLEFLEGSLPAIEGHHERFDGGGYPRGLIGDAIPLGARILAVADAFDAMTSNRPYRPAMALAEAVQQLLRHRGAQWDPEVVDAFVITIDSGGVSPRPRAPNGEFSPRPYAILQL